MNYHPKNATGKCTVCGIELPVQAWKTCFIHDKSTKDKSVSFNEIKKPYEDIYEPIVGEIHLYPFKYHFGYEIKIPFDKYLRAKELLYDNWIIIGWR